MAGPHLTLRKEIKFEVKLFQAKALCLLEMDKQMLLTVDTVVHAVQTERVTTTVTSYLSMSAPRIR